MDAVFACCFSYWLMTVRKMSGTFFLWNDDKLKTYKFFFRVNQHKHFINKKDCMSLVSSLQRKVVLYISLLHVSARSKCTTNSGKCFVLKLKWKYENNTVPSLWVCWTSDFITLLSRNIFKGKHERHRISFLLFKYVLDNLSEKR